MLFSLFRWDSSTVLDDVDVKWRLDGAMTPEQYSSFQFGAVCRQPHSCIVTQETLQLLLNHLEGFAQSRCAAEAHHGSYGQPIRVALVGSSAARWSWYLQCATAGVSPTCSTTTSFRGVVSPLTVRGITKIWISVYNVDRVTMIYHHLLLHVGCVDSCNFPFDLLTTKVGFKMAIESFLHF